MVAKPGGSKGWVYGGGGRLHRVPHLFAGQRDHAGQPAPAAGPGVLHPPMPSSATAEEQIRKQSNSVKNRSAPAQVSRLRGGTGSGEQGAGAGSGGGGRGVGAPALSGSRALWGEVCEGPSPEASERPGLEGRARQRGALGTQPRLLTPAGRAMGHAGVGVGIGIQKADHTGAGGVQAVQEGARRPGAGACWVSARAPQAALGGPPPRRVRHRVLVSQGPGSSLALEGPSSAVPPGAHRGGGRPQHSHLALGLRLRPVGSERNSIFRTVPSKVPASGSPGSCGPTATARAAALRLPRSTLTPALVFRQQDPSGWKSPGWPPAGGHCPPAQARSLGLRSPPPAPPGPALRPLPHPCLTPTRPCAPPGPSLPPDFTPPRGPGHTVRPHQSRWLPLPELPASRPLAPDASDLSFPSGHSSLVPATWTPPTWPGRPPAP